MKILYKDVTVKEEKHLKIRTNQKVIYSIMESIKPYEQSYRIDKNMAYNFENFITGDEINVVNSLLMYFSYSYQTNFFGFGTFDPHHFAKVMAYEPSSLFKKVKHPVQFNGLTEEEIKDLREREKQNPENRIYDSVIENALYFLLSPIKLERGGKLAGFKEGYRYYSEVISFQYLKSFSCQFTRNEKNTGRDKILYNYEVTQDVINNTNAFYLKADIKSYIFLRKNGLDDLYFYLKNAQNTLQAKCERSKFLNFDLCISRARISEYKNKKTGIPNKAEQKRALTKAFKHIQAKSDLKFSFEYVKGGNSRWAYVPLITFENDVITPKEVKEHNAEEKKTINAQILLHELRIMFEYIYPKYFNTKDRIENFYNWLKSDVNQKEKTLAFDNAFLKANGSFNKFHESNKAYFFKNIAKSESLEEIFQEIPNLINNSITEFESSFTRKIL